MTSKEKQTHPWSCDLSRGDIQCTFVTPHDEGYLNCTWRQGHPDTLPHETCYDEPTPPLNTAWVPTRRIH